MHWMLLPLAATASLAAPDDIAPPTPLRPAYVPCEGTVPVFNPEGCPAPELIASRLERRDEAPCRDRIELVRQASGYPRLENLPASPDRPLLMYAVDQRIQDCSVIVPVSDPSDLRQAPEPGQLEMIPALPRH